MMITLFYSIVITSLITIALREAPEEERGGVGTKVKVRQASSRQVGGVQAEAEKSGDSKVAGRFGGKTVRIPESGRGQTCHEARRHVPLGAAAASSWHHSEAPGTEGHLRPMGELA